MSNMNGTVLATCAIAEMADTQTEEVQTIHLLSMLFQNRMLDPTVALLRIVVLDLPWVWLLLNYKYQVSKTVEVICHMRSNFCIICQLI